MKFLLHRAKKDCLLPTSALAVAGLKRDKELQLEVENGVIVVLRSQMEAKKQLSVSEFLHSLAGRMAVAATQEIGGWDDGDCECDCCDSRDHCRGICIPDCLLAQAGIGKDSGLQADVEDGAVIIGALEDDEHDGDDDHSAPPISNIRAPRLRELLCDDSPIPF